MMVGEIRIQTLMMDTCPRYLLHVPVEIAGQDVALVMAVDPLKAGIRLKVLCFAQILPRKLNLHLRLADVHKQLD